MTASQENTPIAQPLELMTDVVRSEWIDYNNHLNDGFYVVALGYVTDAFMIHIGIDEPYRTSTQCTAYTAELHINYIQELPVHAPIRYTTQLLGYDTKKFHIFHHMYHATEGYLAATNEIMLLHVDQSIGRVVPMPATMVDTLAEIYETHATLPIPAQVGSQIRMKRR
ncbi:MAG: thioesterase family protein [Chloroflexota bacterium]